MPRRVMRRVAKSDCLKAPEYAVLKVNVLLCSVSASCHGVTVDRLASRLKAVRVVEALATAAKAAAGLDEYATVSRRRSNRVSALGRLWIK